MMHSPGLGRTRIYTANGIIRATVLVDGMVRGKWTIERTGKDAILTIELFGPIDPGSREELVAEGMELLGFAAADAPSLPRRLGPRAWVAVW